MSHLPDYFEHLVRERGLDQQQAAERLSVLQNAFPFVKKKPDDDEETAADEADPADEEEMPMMGKKKKKGKKPMMEKPMMEY